MLHSIKQIWKTQQWPQDWKRSVFTPKPKKGNVIKWSNYQNIALISYASKVMLKFSKLGFNSTWTEDFLMFKLDLENVEEPKIKLPISSESQNKQESSRKASTSASLTKPKPLTVWIITNCGNFLKRWEYQTTLSASWENCMQVKKQVRTRHGTTGWFKIGKGVHQDCILSPCLFNLDAVFPCKCWAGWHTSWD